MVRKEKKTKVLTAAFEMRSLYQATQRHSGQSQWTDGHKRRDLGTLARLRLEPQPPGNVDNAAISYTSTMPKGIPLGPLYTESGCLWKNGIQFHWCHIRRQTRNHDVYLWTWPFTKTFTLISLKSFGGACSLLGFQAAWLKLTWLHHALAATVCLVDRLIRVVCVDSRV